MPIWIVTGSRTLTPEQQKIVEAELRKRIGINNTVFHGGAAGVDQVAQVEALKVGAFPVAFYAPWERHGRRAGPLRNGRMVDIGAALSNGSNVLGLAFPRSDSVGTMDCIDRLRKAGIPTEIFQLS